MTKRYDTAKALAHIALLDTSDRAGQIEALRAHTLIPDDRLDDCLSEMNISGLVAGLKVMANLMQGVKPEGVTVEDMIPMIVGAEWIDDDKGNLDITVTSKDEDGKVLASGKVHRNHKTGAASASLDVPANDD